MHQAATEKKCSDSRSKSCRMPGCSSLRTELSKRSAFESALPKNLVSEVWEMDLPVGSNDTEAPQIHTAVCFCFSLVWLSKPHPSFLFCSFQKSVWAVLRGRPQHTCSGIFRKNSSSRGISRILPGQCSRICCVCFPDTGVGVHHCCVDPKGKCHIESECKIQWQDKMDIWTQIKGSWTRCSCWTYKTQSQVCDLGFV